MSGAFLHRSGLLSVAASAGSGPQAVTFDGVNDYLTLASDYGGTDTTALTIYVKFSSTYATTPFRRFVNFAQSTSNRVELTFTDQGSIIIKLSDPSNVTLLDVATSTGYNDGSTHELMVSYDGSAGTSQVYVDGVSDKATTTTETTGTVDMTTNNNRICARFTDGNRFEGDIWRITIWDDVAEDLSNAAVRTDIADHVAASSVGTNVIDYWGSVSDWNSSTANQGTGSQFTMVGSVA